MTDVRTVPRLPDETPIDQLGREYIVVRTQREELAKTENKYKKDLMGLLEAEEPDDRGHVEHRFPAPVGDVNGLKRQRRVSQNMDEEAAVALIKAKGLEDECLETITVLDEEALLAAAYSGKITDDELADLYKTTETYALLLVKD